MAGLTDEEMAALEAKHGGLTDEQMAALEKPRGRVGQLADIVKSNRATVKANTKTAGHGVSGFLDDASDVAGNARSAAMGFTSNAASIPEELYKTVMEPDGQNPGWHTEHPEVHDKYMADVARHPIPNIIGAGLQPTPFGKAKAVTTAGKLALSAGRVGYAGGQGALANYLGQGDGPQAQDMSGGKAALVGAGAQALAEGASPVLGKIAGSLNTSAGAQAVKAAGFKTGIANQAKRAGIPIFDAAGEEALPKLGNQMLDEGLIPFGGNKQSVLKRSNALMEQAGNSQSAALAQMETSGVKANANDAADLMQARLASKTDPMQGGTNQAARAAQPATDLINDVRATGAQTPGSWQALQREKSAGYGATNWAQYPSDAMSLKRQTNSALKDYIESGADKVGVGDQLRSANKTYGLAAKTADLSEEAAGREAGHSPGWGSLMLMATGAAPGMAAHNPAMAGAAGIGLPIAAHLWKSRGPATAAPLLRLGSKAAGAVGGAVNQAPAGAAAAGSLLEQYLNQPVVDDDERQKQAAAHFTQSTGG